MCKSTLVVAGKYTGISPQPQQKVFQWSLGKAAIRYMQISIIHNRGLIENITLGRNIC